MVITNINNNDHLEDFSLQLQYFYALCLEIQEKHYGPWKQK